MTNPRETIGLAVGATTAYVIEAHFGGLTLESVIGFWVGAIVIALGEVVYEVVRDE